MRISIILTLLLATALQAGAQFINDTLAVTVTGPDVLPPPYVTQQAARVKIPVWRGTPPEGLFEQAVFFNPAEAKPLFIYNSKSLNSRPVQTPLHLSFLRFYHSAENWALTADTLLSGFTVNVTSPVPGGTGLEPYFRPFWFKKSEVTNAEYREFVHAVRDSVIRQALAKHDARYTSPEFPITLTPRQLDSLAPGLMLTPDNRIFGRIEFDVSKIIYRYVDETGAAQEVPVYPDTLVWLRDIQYSYGEPMTKRYFSHPAFNKYPVTGVNFFQAKAYCHWLTRRLQQQWNGHFGYTVAAGLPFEYEREFAATEFRRDMNDDNWITSLYAISDAVHNRDYYWLPDLRSILKPQSGTALKNAPALSGWKTHPADIEQMLKENGKKRKPVYTPEELDYLRKHIDRNGISGLAGNVSEWMSENFARHWQPLYEKRRTLINAVKTGTITTLDSISIADFYMKYLPVAKSALATVPELFSSVIFHNMDERRMDSLAKKDGFEFAGIRQYLRQPDTSLRTGRRDAAVERQAIGSLNPFRKVETGILENILYYRKEMPLLRSIEDYFYEQNDADGQLVRGGNWHDAAGANAKTFVSPHKASSMTGFRYVIRLIPVPQ